MLLSFSQAVVIHFGRTNRVRTGSLQLRRQNTITAGRELDVNWRRAVTSDLLLGVFHIGYVGSIDHTLLNRSVDPDHHTWGLGNIPAASEISGTLCSHSMAIR